MNRLFGALGIFGDAYSVDQCWPQFKAEAMMVVSTIRNSIDVAKQKFPQEASGLDQELRNILEQFRMGNFCPNLSSLTSPYRSQIQSLLDRSKELALRPAPVSEITPTPAAPTTSSTPTTPSDDSGIKQSDLMRAKLAALQASVAAEKAEKEKILRDLREKQAKQAAYGRDVVQKRPKSAGYATEAEKLIGGQTGYGCYQCNKKSNLGAYKASKRTVDQAARNVRKATKLVEQLTIDVKKGMATKSELLAAMNDLNKKTSIAKTLVAEDKTLRGYGENDSYGLLSILAILGIAIWIWSSR